MSKEIHFLEDGYYVDKLEKDIEKLKEKCNQLQTMVCNDIEISVEYLKQTFVTVDGKKYIELQQEKQQLKQALLDIKEYIEKSSLEVNTKEFGNLTMCNSDDLFEILDKAGDNNV